MSYSVIDEKGKIVIGIDKAHACTVEVLTVKQARAFARDIYAYCRIAEKENK